MYGLYDLVHCRASGWRPAAESTHPAPHRHTTTQLHVTHAEGPLPTDSQEVDGREARAYAEEIGALFLETSAKANRNVQELFADISRRLPAPAEPAFADGLELTPQNEREGKKKSGCC